MTCLICVYYRLGPHSWNIENVFRGIVVLFLWAFELAIYFVFPNKFYDNLQNNTNGLSFSAENWCVLVVIFKWSKKPKAKKLLL